MRVLVIAGAIAAIAAATACSGKKKDVEPGDSIIVQPPPETSVVAPAGKKIVPHKPGFSRWILISGSTPPRGCVESETNPGYWECP